MCHLHCFYHEEREKRKLFAMLLLGDVDLHFPILVIIITGIGKWRFLQAGRQLPFSYYWR